MKRIIPLVVIFAWIISGCTSDPNSDSTQQNQQPTVNTGNIQVQILLPEQISPNTTIDLKARVQQDKEDVQDADEVEFEVWKENQKKNSEMIKAQHDQNGIYMAQKMFKEEGVYYIQAHVTARGMHKMPIKELVVGQKTNEKSSTEEESIEDSDHHQH